jgi:hypothetical protein
VLTYVFCKSNGEILSVGRSEDLPNERELEINIPEGGFFLDITGQSPFDDMDILDIHNGYQADAKKKKLIKRKQTE